MRRNNETKKISVHREQNKESDYNRNRSSRACGFS
nr:MAG TPA: hypothetical protein [Caudoviricetes sp.]